MPFATMEQVRSDVQRVARGLGQPEPLVSYDHSKREYVVGPLDQSWEQAKRFVDQLPGRAASTRSPTWWASTTPFSSTTWTSPQPPVGHAVTTPSPAGRPVHHVSVQ
jgi:hypothetical protein